MDLRFSASTVCLWLISFASVVTYEQVVTCDNLINKIIKVLMFLIWLIENWNHKYSVEVQSKKHVTSNKQLHVFNITKFCVVARWDRNKRTTEAWPLGAIIIETL